MASHDLALQANVVLLQPMTLSPLSTKLMLLVKLGFAPESWRLSDPDAGEVGACSTLYNLGPQTFHFAEENLEYTFYSSLLSQ
jgi:hypothetical protein